MRLLLHSAARCSFSIEARANRRYKTSSLNCGSQTYYIAPSEFLLAKFEDAKRKSHIRVCSTHSSPHQTETPHTTRPFTNLPPHKSFSPTNTNMKLLTVFSMLAFGSSLAAASCSHRHPWTGVPQRPPRKAADKEAGPLERRTKMLFW
jgi:hypothetical protein